MIRMYRFHIFARFRPTERFWKGEHGMEGGGGNNRGTSTWVLHCLVALVCYLVEWEKSLLIYARFSSKRVEGIAGFLCKKNKMKNVRRL